MVTPRQRPVNPKTKQGDRLQEVSAWLVAAAGHLKRSGVENSGREAEELLAHVLGCSRAMVRLERDRNLPWPKRKQADALVRARARRVPLQYLVGDEYFGGLRIRVGPGALIPRPETELLLEAALARIPMHHTGPVADLGTGSGALALGLAAARPALRVFGTDRSTRALDWARRNRTRTGLKQVRLMLGNGVRPIPKTLQGQFFMVVSNPPYIPTPEMPSLQPEVRYEPRIALDGGRDGLVMVQRMTEGAARILHPGGWFLCEIGIHQSEQARKIFTAFQFDVEEIIADWQNIPRIIVGKKPGA